MTIWFTSDPHIGHKHILRFCPVSRPYASVEDMNEDILHTWSAQVKADDEVWCLGDLSWLNGKNTLDFYGKLPGIKHVIWGNHDSRWRKKVSEEDLKQVFASMQEYHELEIEDARVVLFHYPIAEWNGAHRGDYHFHGHTHGNLCLHGRGLDVGVDGPLNRGRFRLYSWEECRDYANNRSYPKDLKDKGIASYV